MSEEEKEEWVPAHERAIEFLESDPDEHWGTLYLFYQEVKVPEEAQEDLLKAFQNTPAVPSGLEKQIEESKEEV